MSLADRISIFVRWFFNASPTAVIEPRSCLEYRVAGGRGGSSGDARAVRPLRAAALPARRVDAP